MLVHLLYSTYLFGIKGSDEFDFGPLKFTNNEPILETLFFTEDFFKAFGKVALNEFKNSPFGFATIDYKGDAKELPVELLRFHNAMLGRWQFLWFAKQHDTSSHLKYLRVLAPEIKKAFIFDVPYTYESASGDRSSSEFNSIEIGAAKEVAQKYAEINKDSTALTKDDFSFSRTGIEAGLYEGSLKARSYNDTSRIQRAWHFLQYARFTKFLPMKIALYIPVLETLFGSGNTEIKHKVAERSAQFIGESRGEKFEIYDMISEAYDVRSRYFHGDNLTEKLKNTISGNHNLHEVQIIISQNIDSITRRIFTKAIMEKSEKFSDEEIHKFFKELIFTTTSE